MATVKKDALKPRVNARQYVSRRVGPGARNLSPQEAEALRSLYVQHSEQVLEKKQEEVVVGHTRDTV
jgi:hypothetical protein